MVEESGRDDARKYTKKQRCIQFMLPLVCGSPAGASPIDGTEVVQVNSRQSGVPCLTHIYLFYPAALHRHFLRWRPLFRHRDAMPGLYIYTSNRLEELAAQLSEAFAATPPTPMAAETVIVQSMGMQRWVSMRLAEHLGVCANVEFPFPNRFVQSIFTLFLGHSEETDAFAPDVLTFRTMRLLPTLINDPDFTDLRTYLGSDLRGLRAYQLCRRVADLYDQYTVFRPDWILAWQNGRRVRLSEQQDEKWQRRLLQALVADAETPNRAELRRRFFERLAVHHNPPDGLPRRISVFGISYIPLFHLEVLSALRIHCDVHVYTLNPCAELWDYISSLRESDRLTAHSPDVPRALLHVEEGNSLLAGMGKHGRDFFRIVHELEPSDVSADMHEPDGNSVLQCVQQDILHLRNPNQTPLGIPDGDRSIRFHSCHSPMREVEVLHDVVLGLLDHTPALDCSDILVMAPDIETYAPLIHAVFDASPALPYSVADRTLTSNRAIRDLLALLDLPSTRFRVSNVMALLESGPILARFALTTEDVSTIRRWIEQLRIRWGFDGAQRAAHGFAAFEENTWRAGLDRLLLGQAMRESDELFAGVLPSEEANGAADTLDRFLAFVSALASLNDRLQTDRPVPDWAAFTTEALGTLFLFDDESAREPRQIQTALDSIAVSARTAHFDMPVNREEFRHILEQRFACQGMEHGYLSQGITFCSMLPMRSIPFKLIYLLGMNDRDFPRRKTRSSFDLMARHPRPGDRAMHLDDRYVFLETLVSARHCLHLSYVGQDLQDNSAKPPSVCLIELRNYLARRFACGTETPFTVQHRLQPFAPDYFTQDSPDLFSYSDEHLRAARVLVRDEAPEVPAFISQPVTMRGQTALSLDEFASFFRNPSRAFIEQTLGMYLLPAIENDEDSESFELRGLDRYHLGNQLTKALLAGGSSRSLRETVRATGILPHGTPGDVAFERIAADVDRFAVVLHSQRSPGDHVPHDLETDIDGTRLSARLQLSTALPRLVFARYATVGAHDYIRSWLAHLLLCTASEHTSSVETRLVGRATDGTCQVLHYAPQTDTRGILARLLSLYREGLAEPLPLFPETSFAFASARVAGESADTAYLKAMRPWAGDYNRDGERTDRYFRKCFGCTLPRGERFERCALDLFGPMLAARHEIDL